MQSWVMTIVKLNFEIGLVELYAHKVFNEFIVIELYDERWGTRIVINLLLV